MEVLCIRHGEAVSNITPPSEGIVGSDGDLTPTGQQQAQILAERLQKLVGAHIVPPPNNQRLYSSPYHRTQQTAAIVAELLKYEIIIDERLREIQKGDWHGMRVADVIGIEANTSEPERPYFRPPQGENWFDVAERMSQFVLEREAAGDTSIFLVSHDHPIQALIGKLCGYDVYEWDKRPVANASIQRLYQVGAIWHIDPDIT